MVKAKLTVPILVDWNDIEAYMAQHDIVEVVRCKDCKWYEKDSGCCGTIGIVIFPDEAEWFYCGYGERREDDKLH